jgi:hypothetical protein
MKLTDEKRKALTEYLGECWHTIIPELLCCRCGAKGPSANRTFIVDTDMMALFRKMVDEEELDNFLFWCSVTHFNFPTKIEKLFYKPERFCNLVAEWLEVKK